VTPLAIYLRSLNRQLPRPVWLVQAGGVVNSLGNGVVFPFIVIYLHNVRGISFALAGLALSAGAVASLAAGFTAGPIVDRIGGRNTLLLGLALQAAAFVSFPLIRDAWHAFLLLAIEGAGTACFWPGQSTMLSRLTPAEQRHSTFALQRISMNLGLGLGGLVGGLIATTAHPSSFTTLFLLDAATFLVFIAVLSTVREPAAEEEQRQEEAGGYGPVLRDRNFMSLVALNVVFVAVGYELFSLLPAFAKNEARCERALGRDDVVSEHAPDRADPTARVEDARGQEKDGSARPYVRALGDRRPCHPRRRRPSDGDRGRARLRRRHRHFRRRRDAPGPDAGAARGGSRS
jgi:predicted MFS family arabinose efflux permease